MLPSVNPQKEKRVFNKAFLMGILMIIVVSPLSFILGWFLQDRIKETDYKCATWFSQTNTVASDRMSDFITAYKEGRAEFVIKNPGNVFSAWVWKSKRDKEFNDLSSRSFEEYDLLETVQLCDCPYKWWRPDNESLF